MKFIIFVIIFICLSFIIYNFKETQTFVDYIKGTEFGKLDKLNEFYNISIDKNFKNHPDQGIKIRDTLIVVDKFKINDVEVNIDTLRKIKYAPYHFGKDDKLHSGKMCLRNGTDVQCINKNQVHVVNGNHPFYLKHKVYPESNKEPKKGDEMIEMCLTTEKFNDGKEEKNIITSQPCNDSREQEFYFIYDRNSSDLHQVTYEDYPHIHYHKHKIEE